MKTVRILVVAALSIGLSTAAPAQEATEDSEGMSATPSWLPSLMTETPEEGFALALTLARKGVSSTQTDREVLFAERPEYSTDADSLIAASHVVAVHFQTIAAANDYWRD